MSEQFYRARAWFVHLWTATAIPLALFSLIAVAEDKIQLAFLLNLINVILDATDGTMARHFQVKKWLPHFDGAKLDDIADFLTFVVVPLFIAYHLKMVPDSYFYVLGLPLLASGYGFCQGAAKTEDGFFTGFPSYWNILIFYFYLLDTPPLVNAWILIVCSILVFVPIKYLYPSRAKYGKFWLVSLGCLWGLSCVYFVYKMRETPPLYLYLSLTYPAYYTLYSLILNLPKKEVSPNSTSS